MDYKQVIDDFSKEFKIINNDLVISKNQLAERIVDLYSEMHPIIAFMKENNLVFTNPLIETATTPHGPLVGKDTHHFGTLYYLDGPLVYSTESNGEKNNKNPMHLEYFIHYANPEVVVAGIKDIPNRLEIIKTTMLKQTEDYSKLL